MKRNYPVKYTHLEEGELLLMEVGEESDERTSTYIEGSTRGDAIHRLHRMYRRGVFPTVIYTPLGVAIRRASAEERERVKAGS